VCKSYEQKIRMNCKDGASDALRDNSIDTISTAIGEIDISDDEDDEDDNLFQESPPPKEDCEICFRPMPYASEMCGVNPIYHPCCGKMLCAGCVKVSLDEMDKGNLKRWCPFCRIPLQTSDKEYIERVKKRMKLDEAEAFYELGHAYKAGTFGLPKNRNKAFELYNQAAELGSIKAHYELATCLYHGKSGVEKDKKKAIQHYKLAAIGGHERARYLLGIIEMSNGNTDLAMKHYIIGAKSGEEDSLKKVGLGYKAKVVSKDEYAKTLRAYQSSRDEMKSKQRDAVIEECNAECKQLNSK